MNLQDKIETIDAASAGGLLVGIDPILSRKQYAEARGICLRTLSRLESSGDVPARTWISDYRWGYRVSVANAFHDSKTQYSPR